MEPPELKYPAALWLAAVVALVVLACVVTWGMLIARLNAGRHVLRFERRRPVPWGALDMALVLGGYFLFNVAAQVAAFACLPAEFREATGPADNSSHFIIRLVEPGYPLLIVLAGVVAVIVAPVTEEFVFRLVLQGGMEGIAARRGHGSWQTASRAFAIVVPAVIFAALHFRRAEETYAWQFYAAMATASLVANVALVACGVTWLVLVRGATLRDLGIVRLRLDRDLAVGVVALAAFIVPAYVIQFALKAVLPEALAPDPAAIFLLALAWGFLYQRTHRIVPSLVSHMLLNSLSFALALAWV